MTSKVTGLWSIRSCLHYSWGRRPSNPVPTFRLLLYSRMCLLKILCFSTISMTHAKSRSTTTVRKADNFFPSRAFSIIPALFSDKFGNTKRNRCFVIYSFRCISQYMNWAFVAVYFPNAKYFISSEFSCLLPKFTSQISSSTEQAFRIGACTFSAGESEKYSCVSEYIGRTHIIGFKFFT